jgi:hypothetical protein
VDTTHFAKQLEMATPLTEQQAFEYAENKIANGYASKTDPADWHDYYKQHIGQRIMYAMVYRKDPNATSVRSNVVTIERVWETDLPKLGELYPGYTLKPATEFTAHLPRLIEELT